MTTWRDTWKPKFSDTGCWDDLEDWVPPAALTQAFNALRDQGFMARQSYLCCSGCAGSDACCEVETMSPEDRAQVQGLVFYHQQDAEGAAQGQDLHIRFGPLGTAKTGDVGLPAFKTGAIVAKTLRAHGLRVKWNKDPHTCIRITRL